MAGVMETGRIRLGAREGLPRVPADPDRVERILVKLLANALKCSRAGTKVTVQVAWRDGEVETSITDRGPGIPEDRLPSLFHRYRGKRLGKGEPGPTLGIGLYITRGLVEAHGGQATGPGVGSARTAPSPSRCRSLGKAGARDASEHRVAPRPSGAGL